MSETLNLTIQNLCAKEWYSIVKKLPLACELEITDDEKESYASFLGHDEMEKLALFCRGFLLAYEYAQ